MKRDGIITLTGNKIQVSGADGVTIDGKVIDLN